MLCSKFIFKGLSVIWVYIILICLIFSQISDASSVVYADYRKFFMVSDRNFETDWELISMQSMWLLLRSVGDPVVTQRD